MQCPDCQADVATDSAFCPKCGSRLGEVPAKPASTGVDKFKQKIAEKRNGSSDTPAEEPLWRGSYSPKAMLGNWILAGIITVIAVVAGVFATTFTANPMVIFIAVVVSLAIWLGMLIKLWVQRWSVDYELTTQRFVHRRGFFSRRTDRMEVIDIDDVQVIQGFVERMTGVGTIKILSSDTSDPVVHLYGIADVNRVATLIDNVRREERRRRGLFMESI